MTDQISFVTPVSTFDIFFLVLIYLSCGISAFEVLNYFRLLSIRSRVRCLLGLVYRVVVMIDILFLIV